MSDPDKEIVDRLMRNLGENHAGNALVTVLRTIERLNFAQDAWDSSNTDAAKVHVAAELVASFKALRKLVAL